MNAFNPCSLSRPVSCAGRCRRLPADSAATALKPLATIDASDQFYRLSAGNVHRSQFAAAQRLTERYENARERVAALLNAPSAKRYRLDARHHRKPSIWWRRLSSPAPATRDEIIVSRSGAPCQPGSRLMVAESKPVPGS